MLKLEKNQEIGLKNHFIHSFYQFILFIHLFIQFIFRWFSYGDFTKAARCFSQGGKTGDSQLQLLTQLDDTPTGKAGKQLLSLYLDCLNNLAACHLNLNDPFKARETCIRVLEMDPNNHRGLLRAGKLVYL